MSVFETGSCTELKPRFLISVPADSRADHIFKLKLGPSSRKNKTLHSKDDLNHVMDRKNGCNLQSDEIQVINSNLKRAMKLVVMFQMN